MEPCQAESRWRARSRTAGRPRRAHVQRPDPAAEWQRDRARRRRPRRAGAGPCPPSRGRARRRPRSRARCTGRRPRRRPRRRTTHPASRAASEEVGEVAHARDPQVLDRAGRRLRDRRRDVRGAALADHDAVGPGALGRAADRAEVLRVLDLVERDDQRGGGAQEGGRRRRRGTGRPRRRRPGGRRCRPPGDLLARRRPRRGTPGSEPRLARGAGSSRRCGGRGDARPAGPPRPRCGRRGPCRR